MSPINQERLMAFVLCVALLGTLLDLWPDSPLTPQIIGIGAFSFGVLNIIHIVLDWGR